MRSKCIFSSFVNPLFAVDKGMLTYSLRERSWSWDIDKINTENITPNVLDLLSSKMAYLSENIQVSCYMRLIS